MQVGLNRRPENAENLPVEEVEDVGEEEEEEHESGTRLRFSGGGAHGSSPKS